MKRSNTHVCMFLLASTLGLTPAFAQKPAGEDRITHEVRHELVMLPYYGVFDNMAYRVDGRTVTLLGQVTRPTLKSDAGNVVKKIEGVEKVDNQIQVLPLSPMDDKLRIAEYRAIYGHPGVDRFAMQAAPHPPHRRQRQSGLEGVVAGHAVAMRSAHWMPCSCPGRLIFIVARWPRISSPRTKSCARWQLSKG